MLERSDRESAPRSQHSRELAFISLRREFQLGLRLLETDTRFQSAGRDEIMSLVGGFRIELEWNPDFAWRPKFIAVETRADHSNDHVGIAAQGYCFSDH